VAPALRPRWTLLAEIALLRHQLTVLQRSVTRPRVTRFAGTPRFLARRGHQDGFENERKGNADALDFSLIAQVAMTGLDAMVFAARHPDLFVAAASFSGFLDPWTATGEQVVQLFAGDDDQLCGASENWLDIWGDPVAHPMGWEAHDPTVEDARRMDRARKGKKVSNEDWASPTDADARIVRLKDGSNMTALQRS
jgi:S-formylglutathione hydrolase FrmB